MAAVTAAWAEDTADAEVKGHRAAVYKPRHRHGYALLKVLPSASRGSEVNQQQRSRLRLRNVRNVSMNMKQFTLTFDPQTSTTGYFTVYVILNIYTVYIFTVHIYTVHACMYICTHVQYIYAFFSLNEVHVLV